MNGLVYNLRGCCSVLCVLIVTLACFIPLLPTAVLKLALPDGRMRHAATHGVLAIARTWARAVNAVMLAFSDVRVDYEQDVADNLNARQVLISNHQCWTDVMLLVYVIERRFAFPRFFIKEKLRWLPVVGLACWALDFPFMQRHSREAIERDPALRDQDMHTVRRACTVFRDWPVVLVNYAEGTRSTAAKRAAASSPYYSLLPPKAGGTAFAINAMRDVLDGALDMSVAYVDTPEPTFWAFLCGRIPRVAIRVERLVIPPELRAGDYSMDADYRARFKAWMESLWAEKDRQVTALQDPNHPARRFADLCERAS